MSMRILLQVFLLLVGQVMCREIMFFARVCNTSKQKKIGKTHNYLDMLLILVKVL